MWCIQRQRRTSQSDMEKSKFQKFAESMAGSGGLFPSVLIIIIVIGAFFIGSLWTKVQILEKGGVIANNPSSANPPANPPAGQGAPPPVAAAMKTPKIVSDDHVRGDKNAPIALIEYSDLECPFCKTFHATALRVVDEYKGKVKWIYRHYPLSFHANAQKEAEASECVYELGGDNAFWKYIDAIYERTTANGTGFALDKLGPLAAEVGVNQEKFQTCLDTDKYAQKVKDMEKLGASEGVTGTPGNIFLEVKSGKTQLVPGALPFDQIKPIIDGMLNG